MTDELEEAKKSLRSIIRARRTGLDATSAGQLLAEQALRNFLPLHPKIIAGFWPMRDEIDVRPLLVALHDRHHIIVLPATPRQGEALIFQRWRPGDLLVPEKFGSMHATGDILIPDMLFVPLLAFDATGARLGYGGGFYDRTLARLPNRPKIGCAFSMQQVDEVPFGPYDIPLDAVMTEQGIIRCEG